MTAFWGVLAKNQKNQTDLEDLEPQVPGQNLDEWQYQTSALDDLPVTIWYPILNFFHVQMMQTFNQTKQLPGTWVNQKLNDNQTEM